MKQIKRKQTKITNYFKTFHVSNNVDFSCSRCGTLMISAQRVEIHRNNKCTMSTMANYFDRLPKEVIVMIVQKLDLKSLVFAIDAFPEFLVLPDMPKMWRKAISEQKLLCIGPFFDELHFLNRHIVHYIE